MTSYRYHDAALLWDNGSYHYMYTPFEGADFLAAYRTARADARDALTITASAPQAEAILGWPEASLAGGAPPAPVAPVGPWQTAAMLDQLLLARLHGVWSPAGDAIVDTLARRFEVAKRLRPAYTADFRATSTSETAPVESYAVFAFLLATLVQPGQLRRLNSLLKVNDLLVAAAPQLTTPVHRAALRRSLDIELRLTGALMKALP